MKAERGLFVRDRRGGAREPVLLSSLMVFFFYSPGSRNPGFDLGSNKRVSCTDSEGEALKMVVSGWESAPLSCARPHSRNISVLCLQVSENRLLA